MQDKKQSKLSTKNRTVYRSNFLHGGVLAINLRAIIVMQYYLAH